MFRNLNCKINFFLSTAALVLLIVSPAQAAPAETPLNFAGYAFSGNYSDREQLYPLSSQLSAQEDGVFLDRILREKLAARPDLAKRLGMELADGKRDISTVAFALVNEDFEVQRVEGKFWVVLTLQANVLAFNQASKSVVASYPVRMRVTHVTETPPSAADKLAMVRSAYTTTDTGANIFDLWLERCAQVNIRAGATKYLSVTDVGVTPEAEKIIVESGVSTAAVRNQIANLLEAAIAEAAQISIVPHSAGEAIGSKMAYRFANGAEMQLVLPDPDFALGFVIRGFAAKTVEKPEYFQDIYRVRAAISLKLAVSDAPKLFDENVFGTQIVTRPRKAQMALSAWSQYYKTLQTLVDGVAKQMANVNDAWLAENATRGAEAKPGFLAAKQKLQELK